MESETKPLEKKELRISNNRAESGTLVQGHKLGFTAHQLKGQAVDCSFSMKHLHSKVCSLAV